MQLLRGDGLRAGNAVTLPAEPIPWRLWPVLGCVLVFLFVLIRRRW